MRTRETLELTVAGVVLIVGSDDGFKDDLQVEVDSSPKAGSYAPKPADWSELTLAEQLAIELAVAGRCEPRPVMTEEQHNRFSKGRW